MDYSASEAIGSQKTVESTRSGNEQIYEQQQEQNPIVGFEDFDDADALMDLLGASSEDHDSSHPNEMQIIMANFSGKDLSTLYENGMMKAVHMEVQENAKIPNLNPNIAINRGEDLHRHRVPIGNSGHAWWMSESGGNQSSHNSAKDTDSSQRKQNSQPKPSTQPLAEKFLGNQER